MANLSEATLEQGRTFIRNSDLEGLMAWARTNVPVGLDLKVFERTMKMVIDVGDLAKAHKIFNATLKDYDPTISRIAIWVRVGVSILIVLGLLGGIVYLVRAVF